MRIHARSLLELLQLPSDAEIVHVQCDARPTGDSLSFTMDKT
jgi:hypothetical protein